ncbi:MAG: hypothetical protein L6R48_23175, partial [Planctomycetes bacterium]|nr:hypothetical protein [Planctomycetota bacterium]
VRAAIARLPAAVEAAQGAGTGVGEAGRAVAEAARATGPAATQVGSAAQELGTTAAATRDELKATLAALAELSRRLDAIAADVQKASAQIAAGKGTVGRLVMEDTLHEKAVGTLTKAEARLDEIQPLLNSVTELRLAVGAEGGVDLHSESGTGGIYIRIEPRPWKFMQAGASYRTAPAGRDISGGSDSTIPIDFNLALGWRWMPSADWSYYHLTAAGGLVENTLGAWIEVPLGHERITWRTMGRLKHNDLDPDDRRYEEGSVLVRSCIELRTWRRLYLVAGCNDIAKDPGPWVGLRGEIYDNDLRNATGVASMFK